MSLENSVVPHPTRMVEVRTKVMKANDLVARDLRRRFHDAGVYVVSLVSSPGSGKTTFLERTLSLLRPQYRVAALVGDLATENDAVRLARSGAPVKQIVTGTICHLEAQVISDALNDWRLDELDVLFIENVGNLVCPATFDLGEDLRLVLFSVTEGEDKPRKYPTIFNTSDVAVMTKIELASAVEFDRAAAIASVQAVRPGMNIIELSAKNGQGMDVWMEFLKPRIHQRKAITDFQTARCGSSARAIGAPVVSD
jgi:hydrogenase nickel incorporation protein HypB